MADVKRRTLILHGGKEIKLFGNSVAIGKNLQIGEGYAPNLFSFLEETKNGKPSISVSNPHKLTSEELHDLADFNIQLWMNLKANVRAFGPDDPKVFNSDPGSQKASKGLKQAAEED